MVEMVPWLREAAETGKIDGLRVLILEDPYIFERIDEIPFTDTPLHIAAEEGQIEFAMEMMNLKPSFARKLNPDGFSPMNLAVENGKTELMLRLLQTDKDLVRVKGTEGMTPFHCVVTMGNSESQLLVEVLQACPKCIQDVTVRNETALHLAPIKNHMKAFNILIGWLQRSTGNHSSILDFEKKIVNWTDKDNNTVLHIAAKKGQYEALKLLLDSQLWLYVKTKNSEVGRFDTSTNHRKG
ncbi:ankyrin repeat-containing protein BDA1-like [Gossypium arboreum]|uniref:ankyrin repeat-containing protein BDA1-like n=1 Tax=Gossypium arboreum TaxID=29729 RepID=UPI0022F170A0|nr:ankyrin repeat-containing protein BDA1-like [Gossypium arboreum]